MGWILSIIIGGLAGWIASNIMKTGTGIVMNIILGVVGAFVANLLFGCQLFGRHRKSDCRSRRCGDPDLRLPCAPEIALSFGAVRI